MSDVKTANGAEQSSAISERNSNQLVILRVNRPLRNKDFLDAYDYLLEMKEKGLILVGPGYEVLYAGPDADIQLEGDKRNEHED